MNPKSQPGLTLLLKDAAQGDSTAKEQVWSEVYKELHRMAARRLGQGRHTLRPTEMIHDVFLRISVGQPIDWQSRRQFFGVAAMAMRNIVVDHVRENTAKKRGGAHAKVEFDEAVHMETASDKELLALSDALDKMKEKHPELAEIVLLRYFGGFEIEETAKILGSSPATVKRKWTTAKLWLRTEMLS